METLCQILLIQQHSTGIRDMEKRSIGERIKKLGDSVLGVGISIAAFSLPVLFILGSAWAAGHLLGPLIIIGWIAVAIDVVVLLPLSLFRGQNWPRESEQGDKWIFCLTAARIAAKQERP
jgi:hypothetical protein